jgi:hypothetical protein
MADAPVRVLEIQLVYALPHEQIVEILRVPAGSTVRQAIKQSRLLARHPDIATGALAIGIFGRRAAPATVVREFDRIEIYRPLSADPKQARRARARRSGNSKR